MNSYLSHTSAACAWNIPYLHVVLGYPTAELLQESNTQLTHRSCFTPEGRVRSASLAAHYKKMLLPDGSLVAHEGALIASPELVFLDLAGKLGFHRAVLLGMQLCASDADGRSPLTSTKKLQKYLNCCVGHHGYKTAIRAAQYVTDNSWSIMESLLYIMLSLPNRYGGYGLKGAQLNHRIAIRKRGDWQKTNAVIVDLYWKEAKLAVEYDSYEYHNSVGSWVRDARRLATLERNGYKTVSVNTAQIYNDAAFFELAQIIAQHLNRRIRIRATDFLEQKALLRGLLPRRDAVAEP